MTETLTKLFDPEMITLPQARLDRLREKLLSNSTEEQRAYLELNLIGPQRKQFQQLLSTSEFAATNLCEQPQWLVDQVTQDHYQQPWGSREYSALFRAEEPLGEVQWDRFLRQQRNRAMTRIIWRDFNRICTTMNTTGELTLMAEAALQATLEYHYELCCQQYGTPQSPQGLAQPMLIIGMGKLGGWELNLSSDVDLIFAYPSSGHTTGSQTSLSNQEFFAKLGQKIIKSLDQITADGFVFRVDMRLRPYGQSGALVSNFNALEDYYQTQGREWERFAMIKARIVASNAQPSQQQQLMAILRSFTYRRFVDFSAIDALRNLKQLITRDLAKRRLGDNIKLGPGGIREVEFIAQAFQLIRGGRDTELQDRRLLTVLSLLDQLHCLPPGTAERLTEAYCFLRNVEHAIQGYQDQQTQELPTQAEGQARIARVLGFSNWQSFSQVMNEHRHFVHQQFNAVIASPDQGQSDDQQQSLSTWRGYWQSLQLRSSRHDTELHFDDPTKAHQILVEELLKSPAIVAMAAISRERFDELMPRLLLRISQGERATEILQRLVPLLASIARRSAYLLLLTENPGALNQLVLLTEASPWFSAQLAHHPALLDELLDPTSLYSVPSKTELMQELRQQVLRIAEDDLEGQMEALRYFRSAHAIRVAACEITGRLPLMKVSDYLTELAEVILDYVVQLSWSQMTAKHGYPCGQENHHAEFLVIGYGKLGGIELGHGSDLDLVFLHDADPSGQTAGEGPIRSLDNATFYTRLGQKIIHILNTRTPSGLLYEVDMRLRPSGNSGLLVSHMTGFRKYQEESAWTWEHQALVRARGICGSPQLKQKFEQLRQDILCQRRGLSTLSRDVIDMRLKMRSQLGSKKKQMDEGLFHLKQDTGGIVDIEFMVQYAVLAWSNTHPELTEFTDNIRILERLAQTGQMSTQEVLPLIEAYKTYRSLGHRLTLQQQPGVVVAESVASERQIVIQIWQRLLGEEQLITGVANDPPQ